MEQTLRARMLFAGMRNDPHEVRAVAEELRAEMAAGDPEAMAFYRDVQAQMMGPDPLADRPCVWPAELSEPLALLDVPRSQSIIGWRMWRVVGSRLAAPFLSVDDPTIQKFGDHRTPGLAWKRGVNASSARWCSGSGAHPRPGCACGIRIVQSRTLVDRFAEQMATRTPPILGGAFAQVRAWGRVTSWREDDDWQFTARCQFAEIVGPLEITAAHADQRDAIARRYGVEVILR